MLFCKIWGILVSEDRVAVFSIATPCGLAEEITPTPCRSAEMYNRNVDWAAAPQASSACYLHKHPSLATQTLRVFWVVIFGELERKADECHDLDFENILLIEKESCHSEYCFPRLHFKVLDV